MSNKVSKKNKALKRKIYLEATVKHFENFGYENANMSKLAKELGISVGTLYKIFDNKENLYFEYILYQIDNFVKILNDNQTDNPVLLAPRISFYIQIVLPQPTPRYQRHIFSLEAQAAPHLSSLF